MSTFLRATSLALIVMSAAGSTAADPRAVVRGDLDDGLRDQIIRAIGEVDEPAGNRFEARRRARAAAEAAEALLRSEGYYQSTIRDEVEGETSPSAVIVVEPGPRFELTPPGVDWVGAPPEPEVAARAAGDIALTPGDPGRAADVIAAEGRLVASLSRQGYADATAQPRRVVVDHAALTVAPTYRIDAGDLVTLNGVRVETRGPTNPAWVQRLAPWRDGRRYDPDLVGELERRLTETGVYDGVGVALAPADQTTADGDRPVVVTLTDSPRRVLEAGVTYSTAEGSGVDALWTWRNRFGRADTLRFQARLATIDSRIGAELSLPHWRAPGRTLRLESAVVAEDTDAYRRQALVLNADVTQRLGRTSWFSYGVGLDAGRYEESRFDASTNPPQLLRLDRDLAILTTRASAYIDRSNDPLDPTQGWRVSVSAQPTAVAGEDTVLFVRTEATGTFYQPVDEQGRTVVAGRARFGSVIGGSELTVPSDRLFYSGGGGSVRGYAYQGVNPRLPDDTPRGGLSLVEASVEVRRDFARNLGGVVFVEAGSVGFDETPSFDDVRYAAGVGVRYNLPFGPIRADVAFPLDKRDGDADFQLYISIGQAF
ncbi:autotransporter assembly complex protein TamA [Brevundimonas balnearis]|uniref:Translocation and assembly module subunit TamA n=1 Tax=Brevundimonas balnearis TaxID=1572858 RepID=A0ABV6R120_9CAUL